MKLIDKVTDALGYALDERPFNWDSFLSFLGFDCEQLTVDDAEEGWAPPEPPKGFTVLFSWENHDGAQGVIWIRPKTTIAELLMHHWKLTRVKDIKPMIKDITVEQAIAALGDGNQVHTLTDHADGHLATGIMNREVFECLIKLQSCKLSIARERLVELKYPLRVETPERVFYVFCREPLSSE